MPQNGSYFALKPSSHARDGKDAKDLGLTRGEARSLETIRAEVGVESQGAVAAAGGTRMLGRGDDPHLQLMRSESAATVSLCSC